MRKIMLAIFLITITCSTAMSQNGYFPICPWAYWPPQNPNWQQEKTTLLNLGVNEVSGLGMTGMPASSETLGVRKICDATNGSIKATCGTSPNIVTGGAWIWPKIRGWYDGYPQGCVWQDTIKMYLRDIKNTYGGRPVMGSMLVGHEWFSGPGPDISQCNSTQWQNVLRAVNYACMFWRDSLDLPEGLRDNSIYIMPVNAFGLSVPHITMNFFINNLPELGIYEHDYYPFRPNIPPLYSLNSDSFLVFQDCLSDVVRMDDSCYHYFENPATKGSRRTKWTAIIQSHEMRNPANPSEVWIRWPTKEEINCQAWLALSRGVKGMKFFSYFSGTGDGLYSGLVDENRVARSVTLPPPYNNPLFNDSAAYRIYDWYKELNGNLAKLGPTLINLTCDTAFGVNYRNGPPSIPSGCYIKSVLAENTAYRQYNYFEVACLDNISGEDYFMLVNRYCQPQDTVGLKIKMNYMPSYASLNYFVADVSSGLAVSPILPRSVDTSFTVTLLPGSGRLLKIIPYKATLAVNGNRLYTNFRFVRLNTTVSTIYSVDSIQIIQKSFSSGSQWQETTTGWQPYTSQVNYELLEQSHSNQPNIFEVRYKIDGGKIVTPAVTAQVFFDDAAPVAGSLVIDNGAVYTNDTLATVIVSGTDSFPGLYKMRLAERPFGCQEGYKNYISEGGLNNSLAWTRRGVVHIENGYGFIDHDRTTGVPGYEDYGTYIRQDLPMPEDAKLLRFSANLYGDVDQQPNVAVYAIDTTGEAPALQFFMNRTFTDPVFLFTGSSTLTDTFTFHLPAGFTASRFVAFIGYPGINGYTAVWQDTVQQGAFAMASSGPPGPSVMESHVYVDNIRLEPIEPMPPDTGGFTEGETESNIVVFDGWMNYASNSSTRLSAGDGTKRVFGQLMDLCGNISNEPGCSDDIILDMTKPVASIVTPPNNSYVSGTVNIYGTPYDLHLQGWVLEFKGQAEQTWHMLNSGTIGIPEGGKPTLLGTWNTNAQNSSGSYLLRLTVTDLAGNVKADTHAVFVADGVSLPVDVITPEFITFSSLPVDGTTDSVGNIYVNDTKDNKVRVYSANGDSLFCFGQKYNNQDTTGFKKPQGIAVDDSGYIWVTDLSHEKVKKFANNGTFVKSFGQHGNDPGEFKEPGGIVVDKNYVYVADTKNDRVQKFTRNGAFVAQFGDGRLNNPTGIAIRYDLVDSTITEKVYVADSKHDRIVVFNTSGGLIDSIIGLGLDKPWDICFDRNNNLFIADVGNNRVVELDPWHNQLLAFGQHGDDPGEFKKPQGVATSPDGQYLYVIDTHNDRVQRIKMTFDAPGGMNLASGRKPVEPVAKQYVFALNQNIPNPFRQTTEIKYQLSKQDKVSLNVYNISGQLVKTMVNTTQNAGIYLIKWEGKDQKGNMIASGVYVYRLQAGSQTDTKKIVLIR